MDEVDKANLSAVLDAIIEDVTTLNAVDGFDDEALSNFLMTLQESTFILSGIVYSNGLMYGSGHDHDEDGNCIDSDGNIIEDDE